tara:strand:- start:419 stop:1027 length:609 start_codon:yes stop_codon:yes gene_type:complete
VSKIVKELVASGMITDPESPKGALLAAATTLFRSQGYSRTTVRDIAKVVGIQSGSLFHHFRTKEDILEAVMAETIIVCTEQMKTAVSNTQLTPRKKIQALLECEIGAILGDTGRGLGVLVFEWDSLSNDKRNRVLQLRDIYEGIWLCVLEEAKSEGILVMEPALLRKFLTGALSWIVNWYNPQGDLRVPDLANLAMKMLVRT